MTEAELGEWGRGEVARFHRELHARVNAWLAARVLVDPDDDDGQAAMRAGIARVIASVTVRDDAIARTPDQWREWRRREDDRMLDETIEQLDAWYDLTVRGATRQ